MKVSVLMGSKSDWPVMKEAVVMLKEFEVPFEVRVLSAHRTPDLLKKYINEGSSDVIIAGAGGAAHLAGVIASLTLSPVIGVPISSSALKGMDALLSTIQMPKGISVAAVGIDRADNAALLAIQMLALADDGLGNKLFDYRQKMRENIEYDNKEINDLVESL